MTEIIQPPAEACIDEFVDYFNARDLEGLDELLSRDASSTFLRASDAGEMIQGLGEILLAYPGIVLTRGELDDEPVAVAWVPGENHDYSRMGFFAFSVVDEDEELIEHLEYSDEFDEGRLLAEEPEPAEIAEWEDWGEWDRMEDGDED